MEREPSEIKKRAVNIIEELKAGSQSYIPLKEFVFHWVEGLLSLRLALGRGTWGGPSLSCQNRLEGHPHAQGT